jgi:phenylacetate-CoA ligase
MECKEGRKGLHVFEDHFIVEIINPETGAVLPPGEEGELVFTTLTKEGFPLIRYRSRDISKLLKEPCPCGRTHRKIERIMGRSDDMLIIRGVNVFPSQIEGVLAGIEGLEPHYELVADREGMLDTLEIRIEVSEEIFSDEVRVLQQIEKRIAEDVKDYLGIAVKVKLVGSKTLGRFEGKAQRVTDKRHI